MVINTPMMCIAILTLMDCAGPQLHKVPIESDHKAPATKAAATTQYGEIVRVEECNFSQVMTIARVWPQAFGSCQAMRMPLSLSEACALATALKTREPFVDVPIRIGNFSDPESNESGQQVYGENSRLEAAGLERRLWIFQNGDMRLWTPERIRIFCFRQVGNGALTVYEDASAVTCR
jgi:hypothetical protein